MRTIFRKIGFKQPKQILKNRLLLQRRQKQQLDKLSNLQQDTSLLGLSLEQLLKKTNNQKKLLLGTYGKNALNGIKYNGLADINIKRVNYINPYGIPFSVKDHLRVADMIQTCGFSYNITPAEYSNQVVQILQQEGCVAYAHTNVPQGLLGIQSANNVYGLAKNPYKRKFISGGSSGGQAIQVSIEASSFGLCSDSAGSIRIPASFCGVYGYKPTGSKRLSIKGRLGVFGRQAPIIKQIDPCMGFMTRTVKDIKWLCQKTLGKTLNNNYNVSGLWNNSIYQKSLKKKYKIGFMLENQQIETAQSIKNSIQQVIQLLKLDGHQVVEFHFPQLHKFKDFSFDFFKVSGFINAMESRLGWQKPVKQNQLIYSHAQYGRLGCLIKQYMAYMTGSNLQAQFYKRMNHSTDIWSLYAIMKQKQFYKSLFLQQWNSNKLDLLLTPTMPFTAPLQNRTKKVIRMLSFCCFQNILELPAGNIPVRLVQKNQQNYSDCRFYGSQIKSSIQQSQGLPVCVQLTGKHMEDQQCIAAMQIIQDLLHKSGKGLGKAIKKPQGW